MEYEQYSYKFIENSVKNNIEVEEVPEKKLPTHSNVRGSEYFNKQVKFKIK